MKAVPTSIPPPESLASALRETRRVQHLVEECAKELASVNANLMQDVTNSRSPTCVKSVLQQNLAVETKVAVVADKVVAVKSALKNQLRDRRILDLKFAAAIEKEAVARHAALHDALTGLPNRALLDDRLGHGIAQAKRHDWSIAVLFIDLDGFKHINDDFGHAVGDQVLQTVARRLIVNSRTVDTVSRYGGDEFVFLLSEVKSELDVIHVAEKLVGHLHANFQADGEPATSPTIRASIGIAMFPQHGSTGEELLRTADAAMYRAKNSGVGYAFASQSTAGTAPDSQDAFACPSDRIAIAPAPRPLTNDGTTRPRNGSAGPPLPVKPATK